MNEQTKPQPKIQPQPTKSDQVKTLKKQIDLLDIKKASAQIELDRIDIQIKVVELEILKVENQIPGFVKNTKLTD